ncbi:glycogenin-1-like isoform X5 [Mytilus galloprovincialis]|uniref:glycogenin-1-like isoform X5 n=1 Tax=Mytilus galloprovincialis TaxID=29158 RepID=UPI003F7BE32E
MASQEEREAFVTLATNDTYALGCLVLGSSLRRAGTTRQLAVMVTPGVSQSLRDQLSRVFNLVYDVDLLDSQDPTNLQLLGRPDLNVTFTKFHCWRLTQYDKAVFLDADTLVLQNVDELFNREELSAAPDAGWPDCFNSGVFVFKPSEQTYNAILQFALDQGSFDGGDQGLLNMFFRQWATEDISRHLPFIYNVVSQAFYSYLPAFKQFKNNVKIVHFIGATKPWHQPFNTSSGEVTPLPDSGHNAEFLQLWWTIFMEDVQQTLDPNLKTNNHKNNRMSMLTTSEGLIGQLATLKISRDQGQGSASALSSGERKLNWEKGQIDYLGEDSFVNIQKKLEESLSKPAEPHKPATSPFSRRSPTEETAETAEPTKESKEPCE